MEGEAAAVFGTFYEKFFKRGDRRLAASPGGG